MTDEIKARECLACLLDEIGTRAVLVYAEEWHRQAAARETDMERAADHVYVAGALRAARVVADDAATRLRARGR